MEKYEEEQTLDENKDALDGENTEKKVGFFGRLKAGLAKTRNNIVHGIDNVFSGFSISMRIFMKSWKKSLSWEISVSTRPAISSKD